jgi:sugar phosphate isomerase/epimerase
MMKIGISNIAWQPQEEEQIAEVLRCFDIKGVEIAPTKIWRFPLLAEEEEIKSYRNFWQSRNIKIIALQALLFGRNDLTIFDDVHKRQETLSYLTGMIELAHKLGAEVLVFGAPKNRQIGGLSYQEAEEIAQVFFYQLGEIAAQYELSFCIEPNPVAYDCDFVTNSEDGLRLVKGVNSQGFGLHLDAAAMTLSGENISQALAMCDDYLCHFHISEPYLQLIGGGEVPHKIFAQSLGELGYQNWVSIEMRALSDDNIAGVTEALKNAIKYYG